jgi:hypothetical protein
MKISHDTAKNSEAAPLTKKARVSIRARCEAPTMIDGDDVRLVAACSPCPAIEIWNHRSQSPGAESWHFRVQPARVERRRRRWEFIPSFDPSKLRIPGEFRSPRAWFWWPENGPITPLYCRKLGAEAEGI